MILAPKRRWFRFSPGALLVVAMALVAAPKSSATPAPTRERLLAAMRALPDFYYHPKDYRVDPYISVAADLQAMERSEAVDALMAIAREKQGYCVFVLCRMLFVNKAEGVFRRPAIGGSLILDSRPDAKWALEPIELVDGVPFLVVSGWTLGGEPETPRHYIQYCLKRCDWCQKRFKPKNTEEKQRALAKLLASTKWKTPPSDWNLKWLNSQIQ